MAFTQDLFRVSGPSIFLKKLSAQSAISHQHIVSLPNRKIELSRKWVFDALLGKNNRAIYLHPPEITIRRVHITSCRNFLLRGIFAPKFAAQGKNPVMVMTEADYKNVLETQKREMQITLIREKHPVYIDFDFRKYSDVKVDEMYRILVIGNKENV